MSEHTHVVREYDAWHDGWAAHEDRTGDTMQPWHRTVARLLTRHGGLTGSVLEIGCGRGDFALSLARTYPKASITGMDVSGAAIATARQRSFRTGTSACFEVGDAQALPFPDRAFDMVISCETLEHVPEPLAMLQEMRRVLAPGGRFILTTENYFNGMTIAWARAWLTRKPFDSGSGVQPHENYFLYWRVKRLIEDAGLNVTHMKSNHFQWLLLPGVDPAKLCTQRFASRRLNRLCRPFGRHFTFVGVR